MKEELRITLWIQVTVIIAKFSSVCSLIIGTKGDECGKLIYLAILYSATEVKELYCSYLKCNDVIQEERHIYDSVEHRLLNGNYQKQN